MSDTKRDIVDEIDEELTEYIHLNDGMTHAEGYDFARLWSTILVDARIEIERLRAERDAALAENKAIRSLAEIVSHYTFLADDHKDWRKLQAALDAAAPRDVKETP